MNCRGQFFALQEYRPHVAPSALSRKARNSDFSVNVLGEYFRVHLIENI